MTLSHLEQYVRDYNRSIFRLMASGRCAPSPRQWECFETSIDFRFPSEFREFSLSPLGGLCFAVCEELWSPHAELESGMEWKSLYSIKVFGIGFGVPSWLDLRQELNALPEVESDLVPFMARGNEAERYCFDLDEQLVRWSPVDGAREVVKGNFYSLLMEEIAGLEVRYERFKKVGRPKKPRKRKKV